MNQSHLCIVYEKDAGFTPSHDLTVGDLSRELLDHLSEIMKKYEGYKVIVIEDRADTLIKIKKQFPKIFAIEVCQGHYATVDHKEHEALDMVIHSIARLLTLSEKDLNSRIF